MIVLVVLVNNFSLTQRWLVEDIIKRAATFSIYLKKGEIIGLKNENLLHEPFISVNNDDFRGQMNAT